MSWQTGNVAFEVAFAWHPSGIATTKADIIVYYLEWKRWRAKTDMLLISVINVWREVKWWDNQASTLYLVSLKDFETIFTLL
jgi:hypothetical protein